MSDLPPLVHPRPEHERPVIDWDKPVGYSHAATLITLAR